MSTSGANDTNVEGKWNQGGGEQWFRLGFKVNFSPNLFTCLLVLQQRSGATPSGSKGSGLKYVASVWFSFLFQLTSAHAN